MLHELMISLGETLYMVGVSIILTTLAGGPLGVLLYVTRPYGLYHHKFGNQMFGYLVNILRSIPFVILLALLIPITRFIVGTSIGASAAIVPLTIAAIPFFARLVESALLQLPRGLTEAGIAFGGTPKQIVSLMLLPDALPAIIDGLTTTTITLVSYSAMAGAVGGGGLGALAIDYGYQRFDFKILSAAVVILIIIVQIVQWVGNKAARHFDKSKD